LSFVFLAAAQIRVSLNTTFDELLAEMMREGTLALEIATIAERMLQVVNAERVFLSPNYWITKHLAIRVWLRLVELI